MGTVCPLFEILEIIDDEQLQIGDTWIDAFLDAVEDEPETDLDDKDNDKE